MSKIQEIELKIKDETDEGVFAISLVDVPAIEENFVALEKHEIELKVIDEERRIVVGFALVPDKRIYRKQKVKDEVKEFNIYFSKDTVSKTAELFMKKLNLNKFTTDHSQDVDGISVIESWVVEDAKNDKSNIYNLEPKGGEWVVMAKIYNDAVWSDVKDGKYKGFSIEGLYDGFEQLQSKELTQEEIILSELEKLICQEKG